MIKVNDIFESPEDALLNEMGIDRTESEKLRSTMLSPSEAVAAKTEELTAMRQHRGRHAEEFQDAKRRMGRVLHHSEVIRKLRTIIPNLVVARGGVNGCLGLYQVRCAPVKDYPAYKGPESWFFSEPVYISWLRMGEMPEYEIDIPNEVGVAIAQKRGWRTVLLHLIARWNYEKVIVSMPGGREVKEKEDIWGRKVRAGRASVITEDQALEAFGYPSNGETCSSYRQQLYNFRNAVPEPLPTKKRY